MKRLSFLLLISLFFNFLYGFAQGGPPPLPIVLKEISFKYDTSGNQYSRYFKIGKSSKQNVNEETAEELVEENAEENTALSKVDYYPNPVEDVLTLNWARSEGTFVESFQVYTIDSKLIINSKPKKNTYSYNLLLSNYSSGIYIIRVFFSDGKHDTFKIIKK